MQYTDCQYVIALCLLCDKVHILRNIVQRESFGFRIGVAEDSVLGCNAASIL
jgi:hypothetical protein